MLLHSPYISPYISIFPRRIVFSYFQLVLLSHLHLAFNILVLSKSAKNWLNIKIWDIAIETGSTTCTMCPNLIAILIISMLPKHNFVKLCQWYCDSCLNPYSPIPFSSNLNMCYLDKLKSDSTPPLQDDWILSLQFYCILCLNMITKSNSLYFGPICFCESWATLWSNISLLKL